MYFQYNKYITTEKKIIKYVFSTRHFFYVHCSPKKYTYMYTYKNIRRFIWFYYIKIITNLIYIYISFFFFFVFQLFLYKLFKNCFLSFYITWLYCNYSQDLSISIENEACMSTIGRDSDRYIDTSPLSDADRLRFDLRQHGSIIVYVARGIELLC